MKRIHVTLALPLLGMTARVAQVLRELEKMGFVADPRQPLAARFGVIRGQAEASVIASLGMVPGVSSVEADAARRVQD